MSIELKQEAQRALEALEEIALAGMSGTGQESEEGMRDWHARQAWKFIGIAARALDPLRTAIQQAESEPVAFGIRASNTGRICQFVSSDDEDEVAQLGEYRKGSVVPLYTHPAPGVPDDVVKYAERYRWLRKTRFIWSEFMYISGVYPTAVGLEFKWLPTQAQKPTREDLDAAIDAAMTAAQAQKGGE